MEKDRIEDLWNDIIKFGRQKKLENENIENGPTPQQKVESTAIFFGMSDAGKTTLINAILDPSKVEEETQKTILIDYRYIQIEERHNERSQFFAHVWEIGGHKLLSSMLSVPVKPESLSSSVFIIVVDLSMPSDIISDLIEWIGHMKTFVKGCIKECVKKDNIVTETMRKKALEKYGENHPDLKKVKPSPVPLIILANKYDVFSSTESAKRRAVGHSLRYIAHYNGATLLYTSAKDGQLIDSFRAIIRGNLAGLSKTMPVETNVEKPLIVPAGSDSFKSILKVKIGDFDAFRLLNSTESYEKALKRWERYIIDVCGPKSDGDYWDKVDFSKHAEPTIDEILMQRQLKHEHQKREEERKNSLNHLIQGMTAL